VSEDGWNPNGHEVAGGWFSKRPSIGTAGHGDPQSVHAGEMNAALDKWLAKRGLSGNGRRKRSGRKLKQ
jgi:hypothetical protein